VSMKRQAGLAWLLAATRGVSDKREAATSLPLLAATGPAGLAFCTECMHNAIMPTSITVRDVPDETHKELASRAALSGQSLQEYLRYKLVEIAQRPDARTLMAQVRQRKQSAPTRFSADKTLTYRDRDRR
jgi:plasmid stability protein